MSEQPSSYPFFDIARRHGSPLADVYRVRACLVDLDQLGLCASYRAPTLSREIAHAELAERERRAAVEAEERAKLQFQSCAVCPDPKGCARFANCGGWQDCCPKQSCQPPLTNEEVQYSAYIAGLREGFKLGLAEDHQGLSGAIYNHLPPTKNPSVTN